MAKRRTKAQKNQDFFDAFDCIQKGTKVKRSMAKDGSIATCSVVPVRGHLLEAGVLHGCLLWLKHKGIFCNRHDAGTFQNIQGQWGTYGIKGSGDIHGVLSNGVYFEIECKKGSGGRLSVVQQKRMRDVRATNAHYFVVHGVEELEHYFRDLIT